MTTRYISHGVQLSPNQKQTLARAINSRSPVTLRLSNSQLLGPDKLMLTKTQLTKIQKSMKNGTGTDIKNSKTQIRKVGGNIFSLATKFLPKVMPAVSKIGGPLLTGALAGLGENLIDKIFGKKGGMIIPSNKLTQMVPMLNLLTAKQKSDLNNAYQAGGNMYLRPTKRQMQHGGFWGALASIGIPLAINLLPKLFGKGLQVDKTRSRRS